MKSKEEIRVGLEEGIARVINAETEGAVDYDTIVWLQFEALIDSIVEALFGEEKEEDEMEKLYADMDQFAEE